MVMRQRRQSVEVQHEQAKTIPIIAMTANAFSEDMQHPSLLEMNVIFQKPVDMKLLKKTIRNIKLGREGSPLIDQSLKRNAVMWHR